MGAVQADRRPQAEVAEDGVGRGLDIIRVMKLVTLVCGVSVGQAAAIEAEYAVPLLEYQETLFQNLPDNPEK